MTRCTMVRGTLLESTSATEGAGKSVVTIGAVPAAKWSDLSGFERAERVQRFRVELSDSLREFTDAPTMGNTACRMVAEFLGVARANWALAYPAEQRLEVQEGWRDGQPGSAGVYSYQEMGLQLLERLSAGETVIVNDASTHPLTRDRYAEAYEPLGIGGFVAISLVRSANLLAIMSIQSRKPRIWTDDESELLEDVARRVWDAIERSRSDAQVRRVTERYRALAETAATIVFAASPEGRLTEVPLVRGLEADIAESTSSDAWLDAIHPDDREEFSTRWGAAVETATPYEFDFRLRMRGGTYRWHSARAVRVVGEGGNTLEWVGSCVDVHDRVLSEQRLKSLNAELDERVRRRTADLQVANEEMEGFTYSVSHDLRAPLRAIVATSKILLMDCGHLTESEREMLERQAYNGNRLATLIDELLKLSRIGRHEIVSADINMSRLAQEVFDETRSAYSASYEFEVTQGLIALGDPRLVRLVLGNLIENAMKFSPKGGTIRFGLRKLDKELAFFISDEGVGFDMTFVDKLFLPFERLVPDWQFPGTGIGLANVKRIVQRHGGRVWAEGLPGRGATFYFTLGEKNNF